MPTKVPSFAAQSQCAATQKGTAYIRVAVVGNSGGGKTVLSRRLALMHGLPLTHVDSIQFLPGLIMRPYQESIKILKEIQERDSWIIDGYGPLDIIVSRFEAADCVIFIDFPLWRHLWWCAKRQISNLWTQRLELPPQCNELSWQHTFRLFRGIKSEYRQMRPELLRILAREDLRKKVLHVQSLKQWRLLFKRGFEVSGSIG